MGLSGDMVDFDAPETFSDMYLPSRCSTAVFKGDYVLWSDYRRLHLTVTPKVVILNDYHSVLLAVFMLIYGK